MLGQKCKKEGLIEEIFQDQHKEKGLFINLLVWICTNLSCVFCFIFVNEIHEEEPEW